jgi:hypothetical protein
VLQRDPTIDSETHRAETVGYNQRNEEIRDNIEPMRREREAYADALVTVEQFNARLSAKKSAWFWPTRRDQTRRSELRLMMFGARAATVAGARGMALPRLSVD